jgi:hypothetical protein
MTRRFARRRPDGWPDLRLRSAWRRQFDESGRVVAQQPVADRRVERRPQRGADAVQRRRCGWTAVAGVGGGQLTPTADPFAPAEHRGHRTVERPSAMSPLCRRGHDCSNRFLVRGSRHPHLLRITPLPAIASSSIDRHSDGRPMQRSMKTYDLNHHPTTAITGCRAAILLPGRGRWRSTRTAAARERAPGRDAAPTDELTSPPRTVGRRAGPESLRSASPPAAAS